ncbi:MAG: hypothetical protein JSS83_22855 [Cyanobacteria bacterium SZAS LIN-3]|nr:hypothetical protein [Cyanobacteria bacterium SZAS LIN-3]
MTNRVLSSIEQSSVVDPFVGAGEISAVALLKLMMRVEASTVAVNSAESLPIDDTCDVSFELSPYLQEQLQSIAAAIFSQANLEFYTKYRASTGADVDEIGEFVLRREDLRPLAYRALMHESAFSGGSLIWDKPFAPRFAESLLLLQKYWDCDFFQPYKDVAGRLTAHSARQLLPKF